MLLSKAYGLLEFGVNTNLVVIMPVAPDQPTSSGSTIPLSTPIMEVAQDEGYQTNPEVLGKSQTPGGLRSGDYGLPPEV